MATAQLTYQPGSGNDEYHSQTNSSNFEKHMKEKLIEKKETRK
jgi:hypothetical protein